MKRLARWAANRRAANISAVPGPAEHVSGALAQSARKCFRCGLSVRRASGTGGALAAC